MSVSYLLSCYNPLTLANNIRAKKILREFEGKKFARIYQYHIRKSGGTSVNYSFLALSGENPGDIYKRITTGLEKRVFVDNYVFAGWNRGLIEKGYYYYAFSHHPFHKLRLPESTFAFTIIREPVKRLISHYKMVYRHVSEGINHPIVRREGRYLGNNFGEFLDNIPKEILLTQLYMFSEKFDIDEALRRITSLSYFFFTESFKEDLKELSDKLQIKLMPFHIRKSEIDVVISSGERKKARVLLRPEMRLYSRLLKYKKNNEEE